MMYLRRTEETSTDKPNLIKKCDDTGGHAYFYLGILITRKDGIFKAINMCQRCLQYYERDARLDEIKWLREAEILGRWDQRKLGY